MYKDNYNTLSRGKTYESCNTFEHDLLAPNTQVSLDNTLHANKYNIFILHITNFEINICMYIHTNKSVCINKKFIEKNG